jgi:pyruvate, water dikinase
MARYFILFLIINISFNVFSQKYYHKLPSEKEYEKLSGLPLSGKYGKVSSVKVVLSLYNGKLYYVNSNYFKYHFEFCSYLENDNLNLDYFNSLNYSKSEYRSYLLANINYFSSINKYVMELSSADLMPISQIKELYNSIIKTSFFGDKLSILLNNSRLIQNKDSLIKFTSVIYPSDIYQNQLYQSVSNSTGYGVLKIIRNPDEELKFVGRNDIIVLEHTPVYLPAVAGIIVSEFQTPLSHLSILGKNRRIPICAVKQAFVDSTITHNENKVISLTVNNEDFKIKPCTLMDTFLRKNNIKIEKADLSFDNILDVSELNEKTIKFAGNKASNLGILNKISKKANFKIPEGAFAIPFYYYSEHVSKTHFQFWLNKIENDEHVKNNDDSIKKYLNIIQYEIKITPIDSDLLELVDLKLCNNDKYEKFRFRSSTNAEDAEGFSGAGLYTSTSGILNSQTKSIEKAIKDVWASLWTYEAFKEREYFNIDHNDVYMGVLVHRSFPSEEVSGVAITKNLYRENSFGFTVNAQKGEKSVVRPKENDKCDQFICYPDGINLMYDNKNVIDIINMSDSINHKLAMSDLEIENLANKLEIIKRYYYAHFRTLKKYIDFGLDIEFKLDGAN